MAFEQAETLNLKYTFNRETKRAGYDWLSLFLSRNLELPIQQVKGVFISRAKVLNKNIVKSYFNLLSSEK